MNPSNRYNAALLLEILGYAAAHNYVRNCGFGYDEAINIVDDIAEKGE